MTAADESSFAQVPAYLADQINSLQVVCSLNGCHVERRQVQDHLQKCPRPCPKKCGELIAAVDDTTHLSSCGGVITYCPRTDMLCGWSGTPFTIISSHCGVQAEAFGTIGKTVAHDCGRAQRVSGLGNQTTRRNEITAG